MDFDEVFLINQWFDDLVYAEENANVKYANFINEKMLFSRLN